MKRHHIILLAITLLALFLRVYRLNDVPPGFRVDELSNGFVVSQHVLDGEYRFFFSDASGHEGLWHLLQAGFLAVFGRTPFGMRGINILLGTLTVPLTYLVGKALFDRRVGLLAAATLAVSFWSLMYSRTGIRHVSSVVFLLGAFYWFCVGVNADVKLGALQRRAWIVAGILMGIGLHTYFAAWVMVAVLGAAVGFLFLFKRKRLEGDLGGIALLFGIAGVLAVPIVWGIATMPKAEEEGRISVVAGPIRAAQEGDFSVIWEHVVKTVTMVHAQGDEEYLYNVPFRPIFAPPIALLFWLGVLISLFQLIRYRSFPHAFLLIWWLGGLSPAFISVPAASFGHTIAAQPAVFILLALPLFTASDYAKTGVADRENGDKHLAPSPLLYSPYLLLFIGAFLVFAIGRRDHYGYFVEWPRLGFVRFLYHEPQKAVGELLQSEPDFTDFGMAGVLNERWEQVAFGMYAPEGVRARWFSADRAILLNPPVSFTDFPTTGIFADLYEPSAGNVSAYSLREVNPPPLPSNDLVCFVNGLCLEAFSYTAPQLNLTWRVAEPLTLPPNPLNSFPPKPNAYAGARLTVFAQLWNAEGTFLTGDDGLWVDPMTLYEGDRFMQQHLLIPPDETATQIGVGLYDPMTGERILTIEGQDTFAMPLP